MGGVITCRNLHSIGRIGNQLFLYAFAKGYAERMGCELQIPAGWWGRKVFANINEPPIRANCPQTALEGKSKRPLGYFFGQKNIDIFVYGQHQLYLDFYTQSKVRQWFQFKPSFEAHAPKGPSYSAIHVRRGDYETHPLFRKRYCVVSARSYAIAIGQFSIPSPVYCVQEGWRLPLTNLSAQGLAWLEDFLFLRDAQCLLRANSTFSVWAGWLGKGKVYSPVVGDKVGVQDVPFVEGNHSNTAGIFPTQSDLHLTP